MKNYKVKTEYMDSWIGNGEGTDELIVTEAEIEELALGWGVTVEELMEEVELIGVSCDMTDECNEVCR